MQIYLGIRRFSSYRLHFVAIFYAGAVDFVYTPATPYIRSVFAGGFAFVLPVLFSASAVSCGIRSHSVSCCQYIAIRDPTFNGGRTSIEQVPVQ